MERTSNELHFENTTEPLNTVEVGLDSIPKEYYDYIDIIANVLQPFAESFPELRSTLYVQQAWSVNFMKPSCSVFIGVVGNPNILELILNGFKSIPGVYVRYSDSIFTKQSRRRLHIEDGFVWQQDDDATWFVSSEIEELSEWEKDDDQYSDDDFEKYQSKTEIFEISDFLTPSRKVDGELDDIATSGSNPDLNSKGIYTRHRAARSDARVGSMRSTIEDVFGLPEGSVKLCDPEGNSLRADARIGTLRRRWEFK